MQFITTVIGRFSLRATLTHVSTCCASFYLSAAALGMFPLTTTALLLARADMPAVLGPSKIDNDYYDVPYKIMVPPRGVGANLLVPVALSASVRHSWRGVMLLLFLFLLCPGASESAAAPPLIWALNPHPSTPSCPDFSFDFLRRVRSPKKVSTGL